MKGAAIGAALGIALLLALHLAAPVAPADAAQVAASYAALAAVGAALGMMVAWASRVPPTEPTRRDVVRREAGTALRNGALFGAAYAMLRLAVFPADEMTLSVLAARATFVVTLFTLGLGAFGAGIGWFKARSLR